MKFELEVCYTGDAESIDEAVILAAGKALANIIYDSVGTKAALARSLRDEGVETVRREMEPIVRAALDEPFPVSNVYGEPTGRVVSLRELIMAEAKGWLEKKEGPFDRQQTRLQKFISESVNQVIKRELTEALTAARAEVTAAVKNKGAELLAETIRRMATG